MNSVFVGFSFQTFFPPLIRNHILAMIHDIYARLKVLAVVRGKEQNKVSFIFQFGKKN